MTRFLRHCLALLAVLGGLAAIISSSASAQDSSPTGLMAAANERYERGEYTEAAHQYESLIDMGYSDSALYFNLGNTYLESDDLGRAILSYLRALVLSPRDPDILNNLDLARSETVDQIEVERVSLIESFAYLGRRALNPGELGLVSLLLWTVSGLSIAALMVWRDFPLRVFLRSVTGVMAIVTLASFLLLLSMQFANPYENTGVVTAPTVEVLSGPGTQYPPEFTLHSGAEVRLTDVRHRWYEIALPGGELRGWLPSHTTELIDN